MPVINNGVLDGVRRIGAKVRDLVIDGGVPGAPLGYRLRGATQSGHPKTGTWKAGDEVPDRNGVIWVCTAGGTGPAATWVQSGLLPSANLSDVAGAGAALGNIGGAGKPQATDLVLYVSKNGNDSGDGLSWGTAKLTIGASFAAMPSGGVLHAGAGTWYESGLVPPSNLTMNGAGGEPGGARTLLFASALSTLPCGDLFAVPASWNNCVFNGVAFQTGTWTTAGIGNGGHIFNASTSSMSGIYFTNCAFSQNNTGSCILYTTNCTFINCGWLNCWSAHSPSATVPSYWLVSGSAGIANVSWKNINHTYTGNYAILVNSNPTSGVSYASGLSFENFTWEYCTGGFISLLGCRFVHLKNLLAYDNAGSYLTQVQDGYYFGRGTGGTNLVSWGIDVSNVNRVSGNLPTRVDTNLCGTTINSAVVTDTAAVATDLGRPISGPGIPTGAVITAVTSGSGVGYTISAPATATATALSVTFTITTAVDIRFALSGAARSKVTGSSGIIDLGNCDVLTYDNGGIVGTAQIINRSGIWSMDVSPINGSILSPGFQASGISSGVAAPSRYIGGTVSGAPTAGTFLTGDWVISQTGAVIVCTAGGVNTAATWSASVVTDSLASHIAANGSQLAGANGLAADSGHVHPAAYTAPSANGLLIASAPIDSISAVLVPTAGVFMLVKLPIYQPVTITNLIFGVATVGAGTSTGTFCALVSSAGAILSGSADVGTSLSGSAGGATMPLTTPQSLTPSMGFVWAGLLINMPTMPHLYGFANGVMSNYGLTAAVYAMAANGTGLTALPGSVTPSSNSTAFSLGLWAGGK